MIYVPLGTEIGKCMGMIIFSNDIILCILEYLNFELNVIEGYGYEVSRYDMSKPLPSTKEYCRASYENKQKEYWYDSFPHPHDPNLAITHPHHKHIHPDIKHNRVPAFGLTFTAPNLAFLIEEVAEIWKLDRSAFIRFYP